MTIRYNKPFPFLFNCHICHDCLLAVCLLAFGIFNFFIYLYNNRYFKKSQVFFEKILIKSSLRVSETKKSKLEFVNFHNNNVAHAVCRRQAHCVNNSEKSAQGAKAALLSEKQNKINPLSQKKADIKYYNVGDYLSGDKKLMALQSNGKPKKITEFDFEDIIPDKNGQWLNQTDNDFYEHVALIDKNVKNQKVGKAIEQKAIFKLFSLGVLTARDDWAYDFDKEQLEKKIKYFLRIYNNERKKWADKKLNDENMNDNLDYSIKWVGDTKDFMIKNKEIKFSKENIRECLYRPFVKNYTYFDYPIMQRPYQNKMLFPNINSENITINFNMIKPRRYTDCFASKMLIDFAFNIEGNISVPLYIYENGEKKINITDYALKEFKNKYGEKATCENIFAYCHAVLSSPKYQKKYEENLKTDYPRIPFYSKKIFDRFVELGNRLMKLQTEFDKADCHASLRSARNDDLHLKIEKDFDYMPSGIENPNKNKFFDFLQIKKDKQTIIFDSKNKISNIPKKAFDYKIGTRCALDWIVDYYKPKKLNPDKELHHKTLIENDLTNYDYKKIREYLFDLIPRVIAVSVEVAEIFEELENLGE